MKMIGVLIKVTQRRTGLWYQCYSVSLSLCADEGCSAGAAYHLREKQRQEELPLIKCLYLHNYKTTGTLSSIYQITIP